MHGIGERLKQRRKELKLSQVQLATMANTNRTQISRYENDENEPCSEIVVILARVLGVSTDWLLGVDHMPQPAQFTDLDESEQWLLNTYRTKTPESQKRILDVVKVV